MPAHRTKDPRSKANLISVFIFILAIVGFLVGWKTLWFLTDDAFIAFRYVSNRQLGHGYVWNGPPFLPVEGYTSFLWLLMLDAVWSITGVEPPESSNWLACMFGVGSLALTSVMVLKMRLGIQLQNHRNWFLLVVLLGMVTNLGFLVWTSSGLETSLFNFLVVAWVAVGLYFKRTSRSWILGLALTGGLLALTRPDGLLMATMSGLCILVAWTIMRPRPPVARLAYSLPLALPALHLFWRKSFYNEWLPNTYFAKHLGAWPEAGIRYLVSYVLEYGLWFWALLVLVVLLCWLRDLARKVERRDLWNADMMVRIGIIGCVVVHLGYYTFVIGGDHFEYRVYSYTAPLVLLTTVWLINRLVENRGWKKTWAIFVPLVVVVLALPIPWTHWSKAQSLTSRNQTFQMVIPLAQSFPIGTRWYVQSFDTLQRWLIGDHAIGIRHQEHKVFLEYQRAIYPRTRLLESESLDEHNVFRVPTVGVPSWILARAHLIDILGLNDYVTARLAVSPTKSRRMAHDRVSPHAYVACFKPNLIVRSVGLVNMGVDDLSNWESPGFGIVPRTSPLTSLNIKECERRWRQQIRTSL